MTYLITGAGRGLGLEFTRQLLNQNKNVIAWTRDASKSRELNQLKQEFKSLLEIQNVDILDQNSIAKAVTQITMPVDVLINNAGVLLDSGDSFAHISTQKIIDTFQVNVYAPILVTQNILELVKKSSSPLIMNISSKMGSIADNSSGGYYAYRMSKTALNMFTKSLCADYPQIKVLCVHPGWVQTDMGGKSAPVTPEQSVSGLLNIIQEQNKYQTGSFVEYTGKILPW